MISFVRHGERGDYAGEEERVLVELEFDSHLTKLGCKQAEVTGKFLAEQFGEKTIIMVVSPFLRTIMTANQIAKSLPRIHENSFFLHEEVGEYLKTPDFDRNIYNDIYIKSKGEEKIGNTYCDFTNPEISLKWNLFHSDKTFLSIFPENEEYLHKKIEVFTEELLKYFLENFNPETHQILVVTHQACVRAFRENLTKDDSGIEIGYCGIVSANFKSASDLNNFDFIMKGENDQLINMD